jgi:hypothetical protein
MPTILSDYVSAAARVGRVPQTLDEKRAAAIAWLGERWVLHPKNAPKRGRYFYGEAKRARM